MGMYDYIICEMPLPETPVAPPYSDFQTKDTPDQYLVTYTITVDRRLKREDEIIPDFNGDIDFYDIDISNPDKNIWWEYRANFTNGRCTAIQLLSYQEYDPRPPSSDGAQQVKLFLYQTPTESPASSTVSGTYLVSPFPSGEFFCLI